MTHGAGGGVGLHPMDTWRCTRGRGIVGSVADEVEEAIHRSRWRLRSLSVVICVILLGLCGWGASLIARGLSADLGHMVIFVGIGLIPFGMTGLVLLFFVDGPSVPATPHLREQYGAAELEPETRAFKALARGAKRVGTAGPAPRGPSGGGAGHRRGDAARGRRTPGRSLAGRPGDHARDPV